MRSWVRMVAVCLLAAGCSDSGDNGGSATAAPSAPASLQSFTSAAELEAFLADQVAQRSAGVPLPEVGIPESEGLDGGPAAGEGGFSGTTLQEVGVDESDVVKTDGEYLYLIAPTGLRIARASPPAAMAELAQLPLPGYGREIYLAGDRVVALSETWGDYTVIVDPMAGVAEPLADALPGAYARPTTHVSVIDVSDRTRPRRLFTTTFDGSLATSRMIGARLHLVVANYPQYYYDVLPALGQPLADGVMADGRAVDAGSMLPQYEYTAADGAVAAGAVLDWQNLYRPEEPDGFGTVAVISMDIDAGGDFDAVGVVADPGVIYSSLEALYLTDTAYDWQGGARTTTDIYKFSYTDGAAVPRGTGSIPGRILNQYALGEHDGYLRVATTIDPQWNVNGEVFEESSNGIYVLGEADGALAVVGSIEGIAPGETVQSARFMGERGYLVTFRQIDPLFTLNLADPANPAIAGELKLPGFSTFMMPLDADHVLAVGQYVPEDGPGWPQQVQLSVFDVSDFTRPTQIHNLVIDPGSQAWSEALWNPKALTWYGAQSLLALPLWVEPQGVPVVSEPANAASEVAEVFEGVAVYRVSVDGGFEELGRLGTRFDDSSWSSFTRGVFIGDSVYAVTELGMRAVPVAAMGAAPDELRFASAPALGD